MSTKRKRYSAVEKAKIALDAIRGELTMAEIVAKHSVHPTQVNSWKKLAIEHLADIFSEKNTHEKTAQDFKLAELYEQIGRLKVENDFLKKKSEHFYG